MCWLGLYGEPPVWADGVLAALGLGPLFARGMLYSHSMPRARQLEQVGGSPSHLALRLLQESHACRMCRRMSVQMGATAAQNRKIGNIGNNSNLVQGPWQRMIREGVEQGAWMGLSDLQVIERDSDGVSHEVIPDLC